MARFKAPKNAMPYHEIDSNIGYSDTEFRVFNAFIFYDVGIIPSSIAGPFTLLGFSSKISIIDNMYPFIIQKRQSCSWGCGRVVTLINIC